MGRLKEEEIHYPIVLFVVMMSLSVTRLQAVILQNVGRNGVWLMLPVLPAAMLGVWLMIQVGKRCGSLLSAPAMLGAPWLGRVLFLLYGAFFLGIAIYFNLLTGDFMSKTLLTGSPNSYAMIETGLTLLAACFPLRAQARYAHILMLFVIPFFMLLSVTPILNMRKEWLLPLWSSDEMHSVWQAVACGSLVFSPLSVIPLIHNGKKQVNGWSVVLFSTVVSLFMTFLFAMGLATFGYMRAKEFIYLTYSVLNAVRIENFVFERIVFLWFLYWKYLEMLGAAFMLRSAARAFAGMCGASMNHWWVLAAGVLSAVALWLVSEPIKLLDLSIALGYATLTALILLPAFIYVWVRLKLRGRPT